MSTQAGPRPSPSLAIVVLNWNGRPHLGPCFEALRALAARSGPFTVLLADNGSTDGSLAFVREHFPEVEQLAIGANLGFAAGNNRAAEQLDTDEVLFLNNDTRIHPDALDPLREARRGGAIAAGARLLDWSGRRLDFDGGAAAFTGHGHALGHGRRLAPSDAADEAARETLFASGAALLVDRRAFLALGAFDPDYFAYYEDVDLGWRMWLAGHEVLQVPRAGVRHRHHGSAAGLGRPRMARLHERNALATVVKNYGEAILDRVLPAALALAACRAGAPRSVIPEAAARSAWQALPGDLRLPLPAPDWSGWPWLAPLALDWPGLARRRALVQVLRRREDAALLRRLGLPLTPVPGTAAGWAALRSAVAAFGLDTVFGPLAAPGMAAVEGGGWLARGRAQWRAGGARGLASSMRAYLAWRMGGSA